jgi:hypothetical protein
MKSEPVEPRAIPALLSPKADAFMDLEAGAKCRREGNINMQNREQLRQDRAAMATVSEQLVGLEKMTVGELAEKYIEVFGVPTRTRNKPYLQKRVAWRIQELAHGGLSERALAKIEELAPLAPVRWHAGKLSGGTATAPGCTSIMAQSRDPRLPAPGSVLVRVHRGVEHRVTVLADGFEYNGARHQTLSKIAKLITGTQWNGHLFFGTQHRTRKAQGDEARG